ncbi:MAG TPA: hypothetical protein VLT91_08495 [Rhizomicrobium sp.]|nr:hypothetical protein [Rhizomicrobium sp.]
MDNTEAQDWAKDFENKEKSELLAMLAPEGLSGEAVEAWWLARARAIEAREDAEEAAARCDPSASDAVEAEEHALAREEMAQQSQVVGRMSMFAEPAPVLDDIEPAFARPQARAIRNDGGTEHLLNGLIAECHLLMRAVTLPSAMRAGDADTRRQFLESAMRIAQVGAKIGRAVAKLRGAGAANSFHQKVTVEHAGQMGGGMLLENGAKT